MTYYVHDLQELGECMNTFAAEDWVQAVYFIGDTDRDEREFRCIEFASDGHATDCTEDYRQAVLDYRANGETEARLDDEHKRQERLIAAE